MTSFQSTLADDEGIAGELAESQREISISEFFQKNRHMLGFDSEARALVTAVKEGVDNSLTWSTPFVYRQDGETRHAPIGETIDDLIESNRERVEVKRDGHLEKLRVGGVEALSFDDDHDLDFRRVSSVFRHRVNSDIYRVTVEGGREVELTDYHSVFVLRDGEVTSVATSDLSADDYVVLPDAGWEGGSRARIDLVAELLDRPSDVTEELGLYGVEQLLSAYESEIRDRVGGSRFHDFKKCDRLPLNLLRDLDVNPTEYRNCELGCRFSRHTVPTVLPVTTELAELLGLYVAEGCVTGSDGAPEKVYLSLGSHEQALIEYAETLVESVFGIVPSTADAHESATNVTIPSKTVASLFQQVFRPGSNAGAKRIPRFIFDFPAAARERFVVGYAAGDGYPADEIVPVLREGGGIDSIDANRITLATTSDRLSSGIRYLLSSIDYDATHEHRDAERRTVDGERAEFPASHVVHVRTDQSNTSRTRLPAEHALDDVDDAKLAYDLAEGQQRVDVDHALALADGGNVSFTDGGRTLATGDLTALPITEIERIEYDGDWVYDVSVPGDENFMAGTAPLACHNSLDATEESGILPDVYVEIREVGDYYRLVIEDNGPGITREQVPKIFGKLLYGSRFHKREQSLLPDQQILVRRGGEVELVEIGAFCDAFIGETDAEGEGTVPVEGVQAPCFDRDSGTVNWHDVTHAIRHENRHDAYRVETARGRRIEVTGNHSLFTLGTDGGIEEVAAADLSPGDSVVAPERIPTPGDATSVNLLEHVPRTELEDRRWYVYGVDESLIERFLEQGDRVRKYPSPDSDRKRTYHVLNGVEVLRDSLTNNYLPKGYLPAEVVVDLGWEDRVSDCVVRTYQVGGDPDECPVTVPLTDEFARFLGLYVAEGHADDRQVGFTFGADEPAYVEEVVGTAGSVFAASTTVEDRPRNATRVKAFGSPLAVFLKSVCGRSASEKRVPGFVFRAPSDVQQTFIDAMHDGDGSDAHPSNELVYSTTSERLARELSYLWSMQGVAASWKERTNENNIAGGTSELYEVLVHGEDIEVSNRYDPATDTRSARYRRLPATLFSDIAVDECPAESVPPTKAGVFLAAGLGSQLQYAEPFVQRARTALDGDQPTVDYYRTTLEDHGFLTQTGEPTETLRTLWARCEQVESFGESDLCLLEVESVERVDPPEYVYDISVPGTGADENFVAGNNGALSVKNSRGQQGIGISAAVLNSQLTSGQPAKITSRPKGSDEARYFELVIDTDENEPEIRVDEATTWDRPHGTRIELEMEANMRARTQLHDYIRHTAVVNPHARLELREPGLEEPLKFERATEQLPAETEEIRPHPHGVELGELLKMLEETSSYSLSGFLQEEFTRVGEKTADKVLAAFRDRHFGRAMTWRGPGPVGTGSGAGTGVDIVGLVEGATANKSPDATTAFAEAVADRLADFERVARSDVVSAVEAAAEGTEASHDTRLGATVRDNAVEAVWTALISADDPDRLTPDLYELVDEATSVRKDDATVQRLAELLAVRFDGLDPGHRLTREELRRLVAEAADRTVETLEATIGDTARGKIVEALWDRTRPVQADLPRVKRVAGDRDVARQFLDAMRETDILAPPTGCLAPITAELVEAGLRKEFDADFYAAATRDADVHGGDPFVVEAGIAYGGSLPAEGTVDVLRFANRVPLVYQRGACATTDVIKSIGWRNYGLDQPGGSGLPNGPAVIMIHVASTNVPFTSESKDAIANVPAIEDEVELAVREAARDLKSYLNRRRSLEKRREKQEVLGRILPEMADKVSEVTGRDRPAIDGALARIMNNLSVERTVADGTVTLSVENHTDREETLEVTEIVSGAGEPELNGDTDVSVVDVDGEWFLQWTPSVPAGESAELSYEVDGDAEFDLDVDGVEDEKVTVNA